jgi:S1-C subfamily serine protease
LRRGATPLRDSEMDDAEPCGVGHRVRSAGGVHQGDVIIALDEQPARHVRSLLRALGPDSVGTTVALALIRAGAPVEVRLTIGERPQT